MNLSRTSGNSYINSDTSSVIMSTLRPISSLDVGEVGPGATGGQEPRRRSVHFDAKPSMVVHVLQQPSIDSLDDGEEEEVEEIEVKEVSATLSVDAQARYLRRKSAPVAAFGRMDPALVAKYHSVELSGTLKALDPELRKSLTKLRCTNIEDTETDLEVVKNKLVGRDELEIYRQKQMARVQHGSSIACHLAMADGELVFVESPFLARRDWTRIGG